MSTKSFEEVLNTTIEIGIIACKEDYSSLEDKERREGSVKGFEDCRGLGYNELIELLKLSSEYSHEAFIKRLDNQSYFQCYYAEIEWVLNVMSAYKIINGGKSDISYLQTSRGYRLAHNIICNFINPI